MRIMNRVSSGIPGLDEILGGGIPENYLILLSGTCGTGKTIFGLQFLMSSKEPGVYVSFEQELEEIRENARSFGWDIKEQEASNKIRLLKYDPFRLEDVLEVIQNNIREIGARRIVFDSISALGIYMKDIAELRRMILETKRVMKKNRCTAIIISEIPANSKALSRFSVEEFVSDGVIVFENLNVHNEISRTISVWKMRASDHSKKIHPYNIGNKGISISSKLSSSYD